MSYNTKNYQENGDKLVIGGTLEIEDGATVTGFPKAANQAASTATEISDFFAAFRHSENDAESRKRRKSLPHPDFH